MKSISTEKKDSKTWEIKISKKCNLVVDLFIDIPDSAVGSRFHKDIQFHAAGNKISF